MGKILRTVYSAVRLDCGHIIQSAPRPHGTEVHCPACSDNEKRVKAARVNGMELAANKCNDIGADAAVEVIDKLIAELEAE